MSTNQQSVLSIDKECIASSGAQLSNKLKDALKLACLKFESSPVSFRNMVFSRKELMQMRLILLNKCDDLMRSCNPFKDKNLNLYRIFDDCYQVHKTVMGELDLDDNMQPDNQDLEIDMQGRHDVLNSRF